uniref:Transmembrane protein n=1 Tax=Wuchereria bancrofti TaxID=6293 RepID=A0AAF5PZ18_WUCBA
MEGNCGSLSSREQITNESSTYNNQNNPNVERYSADQKKRNYGILTLCAMNIALCSSLLIIYDNNQPLLIIALINLAFTILAGIAFAVHIPQLVTICVIYKILCATYLSFLICKLIDGLVMEQCYVTLENIWLIVALICTTIEISLFRLLMNFKVDVENEEEERIQSPPKYSTCALTSPLPIIATNSQLPTYNEALKMIEEQKDEMQKQNSRAQTLPPIYTIQTTETTRSMFKNNLSI